MIETSTKEAKGYFLLEFTRQLIKNNKNANISVLDLVLEQKFPSKIKTQQVTKEIIQEKIKQREFSPKQRKDPEILRKELKVIPTIKKKYFSFNKK